VLNVPLSADDRVFSTQQVNCACSISIGVARYDMSVRCSDSWISPSLASGVWPTQRGRMLTIPTLSVRV
jgi:hypothetical protein